MVDFIVDKFNEIVINACERFSKEERVDRKEIQVLFSLNDDGEVEYSILKGYKTLKKVTFLQILNVRIDFKGYSMIVPSFIQKTLIGYGEKLKCNPQDLQVMCVVVNDKKLALILYKDSKQVEIIKLEELL